MSSFQLVGLAADQFAPLFGLAEDKLLTMNARRVVATVKPGFPCRVSLEDAEIGEELLLLPYEHQNARSPYKASGPIFVRKGAKRRVATANEIPDYVGTRTMSVRAYDSSHMMVDAAVCGGNEVAAKIGEMFANQAVAYLHLRNAKRGCYSCQVNRI